MKFVVNRVHESSCWSTDNVQGLDVMVVSVTKGGSSVNGYVSGTFGRDKFCHGFTIAEVPETEEGYYLL